MRGVLNKIKAARPNKNSKKGGPIPIQAFVDCQITCIKS